MITFLASPKPFHGTAKEQQYRAIRSWRSTGKDVEVILYGDSAGIDEAGDDLGVRIVKRIACAASGIPYFGAIVEHAAAHARHDLQVYLNCDILLYDTIAAIRHIPFARFLASGQRIDLAEGVLPATGGTAAVRGLSALAATGHAKLHPTCGMDYFAFRRGTWGRLPPIVIGRGAYDNALMAYAMRRRIPIVDATLSVLALHQFHDYSHQSGGQATVFRGDDARQNSRQAGGRHSTPTIADAAYVLRRCELVPCAARGDRLRQAEMKLRFALGAGQIGLLLRPLWRGLRWLGWCPEHNPTLQDVLRECALSQSIEANGATRNGREWSVRPGRVADKAARPVAGAHHSCLDLDKSMTKVVICYTHITPRQVRRIQCLAERVPNLVALEIAGSEQVYPWWQGRHEVGTVRQVQLFPQPLEDLSQPAIIRAARTFLEREQPDVAIVADYSIPSMRFIARWVKQRGGKTILPAVTWAGDRRRWAIKEWAKGWMVRRLFDAVCATGERTQAYFLGLGFTQRQIWKQFNVVDNEHFATGAQRARDNAPALRKDLGLPDPHFLFVGALEPWKNVTGLLECYARYRRSGGHWGLVVVGVGSQWAALHAQAQREQIPDLVFTGMAKHDETPTYYGMAGCLVIPSLSETWGLVINEGEAAGLAILASNKCGCVPELVHRGINGYVFEPTDRTELVRLMHLMSGGTLDLAAMGESSRQIIQYYTPSRWAAALADCVQHLQRH